MSDQTITTTFISDTKIHGSVELAENDRHQAVRIALELIKSSCAGMGHTRLRVAISELSSYATQIQEALKEGADPDN